jgi:hypothetical protein
MTTKSAADIARELAAPFPWEKVSWRALRVDEDKSEAQAVAYVTATVIQDRLDAVVGAENWSVDYLPFGEGSTICRLSIRIGNEWVMKADGAGATANEPVKGGISDSFKRAAVAWGIGRYVRRIPKVWVPATKRVKSWYLNEDPPIPAEFLPPKTAQNLSDCGQNSPRPGQATGASQSPADRETKPAPNSAPAAGTGSAAHASISPQQLRMMSEGQKKLGLSRDEYYGWLKAKGLPEVPTADLTAAQASEIITAMDTAIKAKKGK